MSEREQILPDHQHPQIGDWMPMAAKINETTAFKVKAFEPNRFLLWEKPHGTWAWKLEPLPDGRTRLVTRLKDRYSWRAAPASGVALGDPVRVRRLPDDAEARARSEAARRIFPLALSDAALEGRLS